MDVVLNQVAGKVFDELLSAVLEMKNRAVKFGPTLKRLELTLRSIEPLVKQIDGLNKQLDRPAEETEKLIKVMKNGKKLVVECNKVQGWNINCCYQANDQEKLEDLEGEIQRFFQLDMQAQIHRNTLETQVKINEVHEMMTKNVPRKSGSEGVWCCCC